MTETTDMSNTPDNNTIYIARRTRVYGTTVSIEESTTVSDFLISSSDPNVQLMQRLIFLDMLSHDKDVVTSALKLIQQLCEPPCPDLQQNRKRLYTAGAHAVLLLVLKKWCFCSVVTTIGFRVLHYGSIFKEFAVAVVKVGLLQTILTGMKSFPYHRLLQQAGCSVLYTMSSKSTTIAKLIFAESDGLRLIVQAFQTFPTDSYLQKCACDAINVFAERKSIRDHFRTSGMAEALCYSIVLDCRNELDAYKLHDKSLKLHFLPYE
jgi:hypothetical protein